MSSIEKHPVSIPLDTLNLTSAKSFHSLRPLIIGCIRKARFPTLGSAIQGFDQWFENVILKLHSLSPEFYAERKYIQEEAHDAIYKSYNKSDSLQIMLMNDLHTFYLIPIIERNVASCPSCVPA